MTCSSLQLTCGGKIKIIEFEQIKMPVKRIFIVSPRELEVRGHHAHRICNQLLFCLRGSVIVKLFDGFSWSECSITPEAEPVSIRAMIWAEQQYLEYDSEILVLCDQPYDEKDYVRSFEEFRRLVAA